MGDVDESVVYTTEILIVTALKTTRAHCDLY